MTLKKAEETQEEFRLEYNEIIRGSKSSVEQINAIKNIKKLYETREKVIKVFDDYSRIASEAIDKSKHGEGIKILTPKQMLQRLPIALAQVKTDNTSENLLNEIRQII